MIDRAKSAKTFGVVLGTLGHQGNNGILKRLKTLLQKSGKVAIVFLMSELLPSKLKLIPHIDVLLM